MSPYHEIEINKRYLSKIVILTSRMAIFIFRREQSMDRGSILQPKFLENNILLMQEHSINLTEIFF